MTELKVLWKGYAVGNNRRLGIARGRAYPNKKYHVFVDNLSMTIRAAMGWCPPWPYPLKGPVRVELDITCPARMDVDSLIKPCLDALQQAGAIRSDNQVQAVYAHRGGSSEPETTIRMELRG